MSTDIEIGYDFYGKNLNVKTIGKLIRHNIRSYFIVDIFQRISIVYKTICKRTIQLDGISIVITPVQYRVTT